MLNARGTLGWVLGRGKRGIVEANVEAYKDLVLIACDCRDAKILNVQGDALMDHHSGLIALVLHYKRSLYQGLEFCKHLRHVSDSGRVKYP